MRISDWSSDVCSSDLQQACQPGTLTIEPDWSGESYWYSMAALADEADLTLPWLKQQSLQGDRAIAGIMNTFGVETTFSEGGIRLIRTPQTSPAAGPVPEDRQSTRMNSSNKSDTRMTFP